MSNILYHTVCIITYVLYTICIVYVRTYAYNEYNIIVHTYIHIIISTYIHTYISFILYGVYIHVRTYVGA